MFYTFIAIAVSVSLAIAAPASIPKLAPLAARAGGPPGFSNILSSVDGSKCVGIKGGIKANGTAVDM
jgi:hypothetical protein